MMTSLQVDDLILEVRWSARRKTLGITVDRQGELIAHAPVGVKASLLERFVREKKAWIYRKLAQKEALKQAFPKREYKNGEGFPYLGRSYRLLLVENQDVPLKLSHGRFRLIRTDAERGRGHFIRWYIEHAASWIGPRVEEFAAAMGVRHDGVAIRDLGYRWGSCSPNGGLNFHWAVMLFPASVVEYVIVHELAHLIHRNHSPSFWRKVRQVLPDFDARKELLARNGGAMLRMF